MIKTILIAAISADGKIAERADQKSLDWTSKEDLKFFIERTKQAGVVIMGRKTFETIGKPLKNRLNVIMTSDPDRRGSHAPPPEEGLLEYANATPAEILASLDARGYQEAAICGGSSVYSQFLKEGLVDELFLTIEPVLFGSGVPLATDFGRVNLKLLERTALNDQATLLHFGVIKQSV